MISLIYGAAALLTLFAVLPKWHAHLDIVTCAALMLCSWAVSITAYGFNAIWVYPLMDFAFGTAVVVLLRRQWGNWKFALALLFLASIATHMIYHVVIPPTFRSWRYYALVLNVIFSLQLLTVLGGRYAGVGISALRSLLDRTGGHAVPRSQAR